MASKKIKPPKGTRDLYPEDVLRQRYITNAWRDASLRCGFDEIAGPTFESTELYSVKSGEGILGELFQAFSGKGGQETLDKLVKKGQADFALRPEFTPTLARMYAAHAKQLPKPCKWFTAGPYFRAERPQRGRLREFLQWNVDAIGLPSEADSTHSNAQMDAEVIECSVRLFENHDQ
jgi:histidyl-tRNA synthetase